MFAFACTIVVHVSLLRPGPELAYHCHLHIRTSNSAPCLQALVSIFARRSSGCATCFGLLLATDSIHIARRRSDGRSGGNTKCRATTKLCQASANNDVEQLKLMLLEEHIFASGRDEV